MIRLAREYYLKDAKKSIEDKIRSLIKSYKDTTGINPEICYINNRI